MHDNDSAEYKGLVHVIMPTEMPADALPNPSCITSSAYKSRFVIDLSRESGDKMYSTVLAAFMADMPVTITVNNRCVEGIPIVRNIYLNK